MALQPDGKALLGGNFITVDGLERAGAARLFGDLSGINQWRLTYFGSPDPYDPIGGDLATPFGDGVPNLLKYAFNLNPLGPDITPMTSTGTKGLPLVTIDAYGRLSITFVRRQANTAPGITYSAEFANALGGEKSEFAVNPLAIASIPVAIDATWERVTITDSVSMSAQSQRFVRLRVAEGN